LKLHCDGANTTCPHAPAASLAASAPSTVTSSGPMIAGTEALPKVALASMRPLPARLSLSESRFSPYDEPAAHAAPGSRPERFW
jgi:hypothetical protein